MNKLIEKTIGAVRHIVEKNGYKGKIPVGFSIVFYDTENETHRWYYDMRVVIESHEPIPQTRKIRARIELANQFLSEGIKRIFDGKHDDMAVDVKDMNVFQVPGLKGRG